MIQRRRDMLRLKGYDIVDSNVEKFLELLCVYYD